jgi:Flp pilus assembly protein TadB
MSEMFTLRALRMAAAPDHSMGLGAWLFYIIEIWWIFLFVASLLLVALLLLIVYYQERKAKRNYSDQVYQLFLICRMLKSRPYTKSWPKAAKIRWW